MLQEALFYASICKKALDAGREVLGILSKRKLTEEEKELLKAAAKQGGFQLWSVDQIPGIWLRADGKDFCDEADPACAAGYLEAFQLLCKKGLVRHEAGDLFRLTGSGFEKARGLAVD
ncbi:MAG: hypothetical protein WBF13_01880 [Candidatus Zixiibacteriota bacterium]